MLSDFLKGILPGQPAGIPFARTAVSTWETIAFEASVVFAFCLEKDPEFEARLGYATADEGSCILRVEIHCVV